MNRTLFGPGAVLLATVSISAIASDTDTKRQLDSHEHGHAVLNLAVEANELLIEFESPAVNIVGFEHEPENDAQKDAIEKAEAMLSDGASVFTLPAAAGCTLADADVEAPHDDHDDHAGEKDKHDDHAGEKHADEGGETHSEFHATWKFSCSKIDSLDTVDVRLFEMFPGTEEIDASTISKKGQGSSELTPNATQLTL